MRKMMVKVVDKSGDRSGRVESIQGMFGSNGCSAGSRHLAGHRCLQKAREDGIDADAVAAVTLGKLLSEA